MIYPKLALGFATYNGDHMSMYGVNASIPKTLVRYLVKYVADTSESTLKATLYDVLDTPVSPAAASPRGGRHDCTANRRNCRSV